MSSDFAVFVSPATNTCSPAPECEYSVKLEHAATIRLACSAISPVCYVDDVVEVDADQPIARKEREADAGELPRDAIVIA
jgi:hypothetical protein